MRKENWFLTFLIIGIFLLAGWRPDVGWNIFGFLGNNLAGAPEEITRLVSENTKLKAELEVLENVKSQIKDAPKDQAVALVYSRYPFNFKNELLINRGEADGVREDDGVLFEGFLIGRIETVFADTALVRTVFDSRWQSAVRVGDRSIEALFVGGTTPRLTLIERTAAVESGDSVYNAAPDFPYGIPMGEIKSLTTSTDQLFREAALSFPFEFNKIRAVTILIASDAGILE